MISLKLIRVLATACMAILFAMSAAAQTAKEWRDSLDNLRRAIETSQYSSDLHLKKAAVNIQLHQWEYAIGEYDFVLSREPQNIAALYYRGFVNTQLRRYEQARVDYERLLNIIPNNLEARLGLSYVLQKTGKHIESLQELNLLVEQYPDSAIVYASRAALEKSMHTLDAALLDWEKAISLSPDNTDYLLSKADILIALGRKHEARLCLDAIAKRGVPYGILREWYKRASD